MQEKHTIWFVEGTCNPTKRQSNTAIRCLQRVQFDLRPESTDCAALLSMQNVQFTNRGRFAQRQPQAKTPQMLLSLHSAKTRS